MDSNFGKRYSYHAPANKYPMATTVLQEYVGSSADRLKNLLSFSSPNTLALHFQSSLFGAMSVDKSVLSQEMYKSYSAEDILDFFSFLPLASHVIIFTNTSPVLLRLKSEDGKRYDLPLDLFWECTNESLKRKFTCDPPHILNSVQKLLAFRGKTYVWHTLVDSSKVSSH